MVFWPKQVRVAATVQLAAQIAKDIAEVNPASGEMSGSSAHVKVSADELSALSEKLKNIVAQYKIKS
ncbi:MAG: hypothetical protein HKP58_04605 [Desulfatitalea sp.]|nr:hypothetical protein [Desulfatitalea sp.]NNJ99673.1 hypothetical protein [Desulfatitalea sp.]